MTVLLFLGIFAGSLTFSAWLVVRMLATDTVFTEFMDGDDINSEAERADDRDMLRWWER